MMDWEITVFGVDEVRNQLGCQLDHEQYVTDKSGVRLIEAWGTSFLADKVTIFGEVNLDWCERELAWYRSQSLSVMDIPPPVPVIWAQVADEHGYINSNYGWMFLSEENWSQFDNVVAELKRNPTSRRAVAIYTRPSMWNDYDRDGRSDFCCTNAVQYLIRHGTVNAVVQMRSNDAVFGYKGDRYWQVYALGLVADALGVPAGEIIWQAGSLHVYERHFYLVDHWNRTGEPFIKKIDYNVMYPESEWAI